MKNVGANNIVENLAPSAETVQTAIARSVVHNDNSFWVLYGQHDKPTFLDDAGNGQQLQRDAALSYVNQWRVCLDIGSNVGQWTRPLARRFESVVCFEPNPNFIECFKKNINEKNVIIWPVGLSDSEHKAKQHFNSTQLQHEDGEINCRTLDSFGLTNVDFVKIDVDGFEYEVVSGARETLRNNNPVLNIEMKRDKRPEVAEKTRKLLQKLGYRYIRQTRSDQIWLNS